MPVTALVLIKAETDKINEVAVALAEIDGVTEVFSVAGRYDLVANVRGQRNEDIADLVSGKMHKVSGIKESETLIAFRVYRKSDLDAGFSLGAD
jgi:DNA-binding Lrp family transcriptional regulator